MIRKKRTGMFQTNSSSAHTIVVAPGEWNLKPPPYKYYPQETLVPTDLWVPFGDFGWEEDAYHGWYDKAIYAATWAFHYGCQEHREMLRDVLKKHVPNVKEVCFGLDHDDYGQKEFKVDDPQQYIERFAPGGIDHESTGVMTGIFNAGEEELAEYLFSENSVLYTGNDNADPPDPEVPEGGRRY